jgi:hypothetical protein
VRGFLIGTAITGGISLAAGVAAGSDDPLGDALGDTLESLDPLDASSMGDAEITPAMRDEWDYYDYHQHQMEMSRLAAHRMAFDDLAKQGFRSNGFCPTPSGNPSRASRFGR